MTAALAGRLQPVLAAGLILLLPLSRSAAVPSEADEALPDTTAVDSLTPVEFPEVEVTATRVPSPLQEVPFSVDRLGAGSFRGESGVSLDEALRELPGVAVSDRGNLSQGDRVSIRGIGSRASFGVRGIRVLVDDVPLTMPDGQSQLNNLDLHAVGDVEVLRGPSSWLYGNAAGGVIHFRTRPPAAGGRDRAGGDRRFRRHEAGAGVGRSRGLGTRSPPQRRTARTGGGTAITPPVSRGASISPAPTR